MRCVVF